MNPFSILAVLLQAIGSAVVNRLAPLTRKETRIRTALLGTPDAPREPVLLVRRSSTREYWEVAAPPRRLFGRRGRALGRTSPTVLASPDRGVVLEAARLLLGGTGGGAIWVQDEPGEVARVICISSGGGVAGALGGTAAEAALA